MEQALPLDENLLSSLPGDHDFQNEGVDELSAEEYLALVRREAERLPGVVRVAAPNSHPKSECMPRVASIQHCPEAFLPDAAWVDDICASFSDVRDILARKSMDTSTRERRLPVPPMKSRRRWEILCFGDDAGERALEESAIEEEEDNYVEANISTDADRANEGGTLEVRKVQLMEWLHGRSSVGVPDDAMDGASDDHEAEEDEEGEDEEEEESGGKEEEEDVVGTESAEVEEGEVVEPYVSASTPAEPSNVTPSMQLMLQFDQVLTQRLLGYHIEWLGAIKQLTRPRCAWLYCLMARIEKPLSGDAASGMRQLYRICCNARADLVNKAIATASLTQDGDHAATPEDLDPSLEDELAMLNTIIAITGLYFGQGEEFAQLSET